MLFEDVEHDVQWCSIYYVNFIRLKTAAAAYCGMIWSVFYVCFKKSVFQHIKGTRRGPAAACLYMAVRTLPRQTWSWAEILENAQRGTTCWKIGYLGIRSRFTWASGRCIFDLMIQVQTKKSEKTTSKTIVLYWIHPFFHLDESPQLPYLNVFFLDNTPYQPQSEVASQRDLVSVLADTLIMWCKLILGVF